MIPRYTRAEMGRIWSEENRFRQWLEVEQTIAEIQVEMGLIPAEAAHAIRTRGGFSLERIQAIEAEVRHDVIAFTTAVGERVGPDARWLHFGLTSNDVIDTGQALQLRAGAGLLAAGQAALGEVLGRRAREFH